MEATPLRTRQRIIELYAEGKKTKEIASLFGLCKAATRRVKQHLRERGTLAPLPRNAGAKGKHPSCRRSWRHWWRSSPTPRWPNCSRAWA